MSLPVSFLSDFGRTDEFVGVVHGVIARIAPEVRVLDIGHDFPRGDIRAGAMALARSIQYMPQGVALAVVDPGVGTERRAICAQTEWGHFIGPDNGLLAPAVAMVGGADRMVALENPELQLPAEGATFHGRDVFGPAAAVIASGQATIDDLGPDVAPDSVTPLMMPLVEHQQNAAIGEVLWVDHFGNAQTNIAPGDLQLLGLAAGDDVVMRIGSGEHRLPWVGVYGEVGRGEGLLHVDSYGQIAVAVRDGRADELYPLAANTAVSMYRPAGGNRIEIQGVNPDV
ncbi:MAG TPA: SAM-dependent chlorinase/fluorinase [Acidimicrobiia bacterium]|jgi:S-adenosylmethionine hydrolase|nr:SAM-dependent chlorinase/fluorinase [Acidimicrobiia bacterium]